MNREHRAVIAREVRVTDDDPGRFEAVVMNYGTLDDYSTIFDPGCFTESLEKRAPRITWGHEWTDVIGRWVDYKDSDTELRLIGQLDDFDAVPRAKQAWAQLRSGTIDQFSVGFMRQEVEQRDGVEHFTRCQLDEVALVLVGAVPGTGLVSVRSARGQDLQVPGEALQELGRKFLEAALEIVAMPSPPLPTGVEGSDEPGGSSVGDAAALVQAEAEADAALEAAGI